LEEIIPSKKSSSKRSKKLGSNFYCGIEEEFSNLVNEESKIENLEAEIMENVPVLPIN
jgi:hypothetical protein